MPAFKKYRIFVPKCNDYMVVFAVLPHTVDVEQWTKQKADDCDCGALAAEKVKAREQKQINPLKASKKSA
jgi:hypothetical protein